MALSPLLFHEKLTWIKVLGLFYVCGGAALINGWWDAVNVSGFLCGMMSAICYAAMLILNKKAAGVDGMENSLLQMVSAAATVLLLLGIQGEIGMTVAAAQWPWILLLRIVNTGFGCWCYFSSIGALSVQTVAVCGYLEPLAAVVFSTLLLHERMTVPQLIGAALIIGGALFSECIRKENFHNKYPPA